MSHIFKRNDSPYYWWSAQHKGRRVRRSTKMYKKHLAKKVQEHWDLKLILEEFDFLGPANALYPLVKTYSREYLNFIFTRKSENVFATATGILARFLKFLEEKDLKYLDEISVKTIDEYIDWLPLASKTKKNHLGEISRMLDQACKENVLKANPAKQATLPRITHADRHRMLEPIDLLYIRRHAGSWTLYFDFLLYTGLRAGDVAMLTYGCINRKKRAITSFIRKSRRIHEFPLADSLLCQIPEGRDQDEPLFPFLFANTDKRLNSNLRVPREYLQAILAAEGRPKATLHSFRRVFNNTLRDFGLGIEDRQVLLAHSSSLTTKIYTNPNFELASKYVNRLQEALDPSTQKNVAKT